MSTGAAVALAVAGVAVVGLIAWAATRPQVGSASQVIQEAPDTTESIGVAAVSAIPELVSSVGGLFGPAGGPAASTYPGYYEGGKRRA